MTAISVCSPHANPTEGPDNFRRRAASAWYCQNPELRADFPSHWRPSGKCRLTFVGLAGAVLVAAGFIATRWSNWFLVLVAFGLAVNWLGESLERAVSARRGVTFHYYGYFINNSADLVAQTLMIMALGFSPYFTIPSALLVLSLYLLLSSYKYLLVVFHGDEQPSGGLEPKGVRLLVMGWSLSAALIGHELAAQRIRSFATLDVVVGGLSICAFIIFILIVRRDLARVRLQERAGSGCLNSAPRKLSGFLPGYAE